MNRKIKILYIILKKINHKKALSFLLMLLFEFVASNIMGQQNINDIVTSFTQYHQRSIKEKLFVHTDKNFYIAGEIMWFKLYVVDASMHTPLTLSKVAYVEIIDSSNSPVLQGKISLTNAGGAGSFYLPLTLNSGNYKFRAYTNWMKNYGADYFFEKNFSIVNVQKPLNIFKEKPIINKIDIQFFPEGGNMVNNIPCKLAFKGTNQYGGGINFKGFLIDNKDTILSFVPQHAGMGFFYFTPQAQHTYKALIKTHSGQIIIKELQPAFNSGYVMHLMDSANEIRVSVKSDLLAKQPIYLFAHTREIVKVALMDSLQNDNTTFAFDKNLLADGISTITIFNSQRQPVCERLYFKKPAKKIDLELNTDQPEYSIRQKINVSLNAGNIGDDTANISMSIFRFDSLQLSTAPTIYSYMLLSSDLKGYIQDPNYYFLNDDRQTNIALDNLMLTNGWRRYKWEEILNNIKPYFEYPPEYKGSIVEGTLANVKTGIPAAGIETYISSPGFQNAFNSSASDASGYVAFELRNFYGPQELIFQTLSPADSNYKVKIKNPYSTQFSGTPFPLFYPTKSIADNLREQSISMQVQNIYSSKMLKHFNVHPVDSVPFYIHADARYLLDNYKRFTTIEEILREYVILVDLKKREGKYHYSVFDFANNEMLKTDPLVLLDGVPVLDLNKFMEVDPLKLYKLEVVNRRYFLGTALFNGILNWTSYKRNMADYEPGNNAAIIDYNGLQVERQFYQPAYSNEEERSSHVPDFRNVLLWRPDIKVSDGMNGDFKLYASDLPGQYVVEVQGVSTLGKCVYKTCNFTVKKKN